MFATTKRAARWPGATVDVAGRLGLAAAPIFALMAWISATGPAGMAMCSTAFSFVPINDMALMYLLMSVFHLPPWLKLLPHARRAAPPAPLSTPQIEGD